MQCVKVHFLDQSCKHLPETGKLRESSCKQAGFGYHTDKDEELVGANEQERYLSVLVTVIVRLDALYTESAFQVLGYEPQPLVGCGAAGAFMSCLYHHTSTVGGHKVALFIGYPFPYVSESRLRRVR